MIERHWICVERTTLPWPDPGLRGPCRVVQLTDLHLDPGYDFDYLDSVIAEANALAPDLVLLTGDLITRTSSAMADIAPHLGRLKAPGGVIACLGNHDQWNGPLRQHRRTLGDHGVRVLDNETVPVTLPCGELLIAGLQSVWGGIARPDRALKSVPRDRRALLLAHEPDVALSIAREIPDARIALQLSGHTHGGQICFPGGIAPRTPRYGHEFIRGLYLGKTPWPVYVSRGTGTLSPAFRVAARPEITCLTLVPG